MFCNFSYCTPLLFANAEGGVQANIDFLGYNFVSCWLQAIKLCASQALFKELFLKKFLLIKCPAASSSFSGQSKKLKLEHS